ncbi:WD repeat-containing protein 64-like [Rhincodon typus]|uniref:WD repeat-containing protein 64-like n=1 Tax=Rhincodon typus TaxID=259920 RepID=UPI002030E1B8|nr:WD repeat-containing protein 64-like [Rhincodon typus]
MSIDDLANHGLDYPFIDHIFKDRLDQFNNLIAVMLQNLRNLESNKRMSDFEPITYDEFYDMVQDLFNDELKAEFVKACFRKINIGMQTPIDWCELFGYFPSDEKSIMDIMPIFVISKRQLVELREEEKRRHDHIHCVVNVPHLDQVLVATLKGIILLYNSQDISQLTGCDYLSQLKRVVAVTETSIVIWDHKPKTKNQTNFLTLKPMKNIMLCICTVNLPEYTDEDCMLIGDDAGFLNRIIVGSDDLNFQKSMESDALQSQALDPRLLRRPILRRKLHNGWVLKVKYFAHLNCFACCSPDSVHSLVLDDIRKLGDCQPIRTVSIPRGVNAFDYCVKANTVVTGGEDKILRLWNPSMFSKPKALMHGHNCIITDVVINEADQHIISLSTEGMFRVWDVQTLAVLQVFTTGERKGDRHINIMIFDAKNKRLITGSNKIELVPLMSAVQDSMLVPQSHEKSINVLAYSKMNSKLASICSKSVLMVWEMQTGKKMYQIEHPHGHGVEVTAGAVDQQGTQLITGAADGLGELYDSLKTREEMCYDAFPAVDGLIDTALSGIDVISVNDENLLAVGWLNLIMIWNLEMASLLQVFNEEQISETQAEVKEQEFMQDVTSSKVQIVKFIPLKIKVNDTEITGASSTFQSQSSSTLLNKVSKSSLMFKFTDSYAPSEYSQSELDVTPALISTEDFNERIFSVLQPDPVLLSAHQDGSIQFWSMEGNQFLKIMPTIQFSSPITAVCVDDAAALLLAGNQRGYVIIWDIAAFLDDPSSSNKDSVNRLVSWRAHNFQIVSLFHVHQESVAVTASIDCSIRVWYAPNGHYIGYFGQHSPFVLMNPSKFVLPCDIIEAPVESQSNKPDKSDQLDYPLKLDWERWKPFDRDEYNLKLTQERKVLDMDHDKKLFKSVTIPRLKSKPIENSISGTRAMGAVFRALPVYTINPLFRMNPFEGISISSEEGGGHDSLYNFFAGERKVFANVKKESKVATLNPIKTCHVFNATPTPPTYVML